MTLEAKARHAAIWADQAGQLELVKDADLAHYLATILVETPAVQDLIRERVERDYRAGRERLLRREGAADTDRQADSPTVIQGE